MRRKGNGNFLGTTLQVIQLGQTIASMLPKAPPEYKEPPLQNTHPMEGMASVHDLEQYTYKHRSFYLGRIHPDHGTNFQAGINDDRHVFIVAGNSSGKGRSLLIQNALRWKGGLFAIDPKGEMASICAMRRGTEQHAQGTGTSVRHFLGQNVIILDPKNEVTGASRIYKRRYNPLSDIDMTSIKHHGDIEQIANGLIVPESGESTHFSESAETIIAGVIEFIMLTYAKPERNLLAVRQFLMKDWVAIYLLLADCDPDEEVEKGQEPSKRGRIPHDGLAAEAANIIKKLLTSDEIGSFNSTMSRNLKWMGEPLMKAHIAQSDISLKQVVQSGGSVFVVIPPNEISKYKNWLRVIMKIAIGAKVELGTNQPTQQTLFLIDEFALLGRFKEIEESAGYLRGYNCKLVPVIQNIGQIKGIYKENWETFLGNAGAVIGFALNDETTEEYLSKRTGKILAWETSFSINSGMSAQGMNGGISEGKTTSQGQRERHVRLPNEVKEQTMRNTMRALVIPADSKPLLIQRQNYDDIPAQGIFDSPQFNVLWEKEYGGEI